MGHGTIAILHHPCVFFFLPLLGQNEDNEKNITDKITSITEIQQMASRRLLA
jgi:hypothetical protein